MKKLEIVIATGNKNKVKEYLELFEGFDVKVTSMKEEGIDIDIDENGTTFEANSMIKASEVAKLTDKIVIADDSGLSVHALDNFPGIYSARFMDGHPYEEKHIAILDMLKDKEDKSAHFTCAISVCNLKGTPDQQFVGICEGNIVSPRSLGNGFGYDPIFEPVGLTKTFGELSDEEKNKISHRGIASEKLISFLKIYANR